MSCVFFVFLAGCFGDFVPHILVHPGQLASGGREQQSDEHSSASLGNSAVRFAREGPNLRKSPEPSKIRGPNEEVGWAESKIDVWLPELCARAAFETQCSDVFLV